MSKATIATTEARATRAYPKLNKIGEGSFSAEVPDDLHLEKLLGMQTAEAAKGVYLTAIGALGQSGEKFGSLATAMFAELEPR